ncbi:MAG: EAL domain-containing protein [Synechocystis sp.]|jgi:EAL domain-containing protein (putative c-di-GMP-specific phosphodiesterase class I)/CheY-like chemotaxis protein
MSTILIVEDEIIIQELIGETLSLEGYDVLEASNGRQALTLLENLGQMPDLIICDVMMPEMDGHSLIEALQTNPKTAAIPFIFLTALGTIQDFRKGMNSGADDYLVKPFKQEELLAAVNSRLQKKAKLSAFYQEENQSRLTKNGKIRERRKTPTLSSEEISLWRELDKALDNNEIYLNYQPQVAIASHHLVGCEALVRWRHPEHGIISPGRFIHLAEKVGLIDHLGEWVIESVLQQCHQWQTWGLPTLRVGINISAQQFQGKALGERLKAGLEKYNLPPEQLEVELTESLLVKNVKESIQQLQSLRDYGFKVAIDDFGTGYSSLSYLQSFPFDVLKIDQSFVRNINTNPKNETITASIINLAHQLELQVIAEGVETWAEYDTIATLGCDNLQGYLFSRPLGVEGLTALLQKGLAEPLSPSRPK